MLCARVISVNEWVYPDIFDYASASNEIRLDTPRGSFAACQIMIHGTQAGQPIRVEYTGALSAPECFRMLDVYVEKNTASIDDYRKDTPKTAVFCSREAPFRVCDCLQSFDQGGNITEGNVTALYLAFPVPVDAVPGVCDGDVKIEIGDEAISIPCTINVHKAVVPEKGRMLMTNWICTSIAKRYGVEEKSDEWYRIYRQFIRLMCRCRQTHMRIGLNDIVITQTAPGIYEFDFTRIKRTIEETIAAGMPGIELGHLTGKDYNLQGAYFLFYQPEGRLIPAASAEGYRFLAQFLPKWTAFLKENGWYDLARQHIGDEPMDHQANDYRAICCTVRKFMPGMRFFDAVSSVELRGAVDSWVPLNQHYQEHREVYEEFRELGDELWQYTCCFPVGKWLNRFLDMELLRPRLLYYGNYRYDLKGFLHWAFAGWADNQIDLREHSHGIINDGTTFLPPGDTHICYPGNENGPWMSMRAELTRLGIEDCELLWQIGEKNRALADELCTNVMRSFDDYTLDVAVFEENHRRILDAADAL